MHEQYLYKNVMIKLLNPSLVCNHLLKVKHFCWMNEELLLN